MDKRKRTAIRTNFEIGMNNILKKVSLNKSIIFGFLISFIAAYSMLPGFFEFSFYPVDSVDYLWKSLDSSWSLALSYANQNNFVWGKDIAFTYGPLSFLALRTTMGINKYILLLSDVFYIINLFLMFFISYKKAANKLLVSILILVSVLFVPNYLGGGYALLLLFIFIFWLRIYIDNPINYFLMPPIIILIILFFVKFNTGLISFVIYFVCLIYVFINFRNKRIVVVTAFLLVPFFIYILSFILNVTLINYVFTGFNFVTGYNEIMYLNTSAEYGLYFKLAYIFIIISLFYLIIKFCTDRHYLQKKIVVLFMFSSGLFVLYKQAFVRADIGHVFEFFIYSLLIILLSQEFVNKKTKSFTSIVFFALIIIPLFAFYKYSTPAFLQTVFKEKLIKKEYFTGFIKTTSLSGNNLYPNNNALPQNILSKISQKTVDVFPWNIHLILENKLNYLPRPVLQSYISYTKQLENLNFELYNSNKGPNQVLYDYASIDTRYPLFDEAKVNQVLLHNYHLTDTLYHNGRSMLLLEKNQNATPIKFVLQKEYAIKVGSAIIPEKDVYYEAYLYPKLKCKIISTFSYSPEIYIQIVTKKGFSDFRISKPLLETGFFGNNLISSTSDFKSMLLKEKIKEDNLVKGYYFKLANEDLYLDKIRIKEYKIIQ